MNDTQKIILDADVIIHFYRGKMLSILPKIFSNEYIICDILLEFEILPGALNDLLQDLLDSGEISIMELEQQEHNLDILMEYSELLNRFGKGESACMAYCKFTNNVIGSSNLKDISTYCKMNSIEYLTTLDFLKKAFDELILSEEECNEFMDRNIKGGSRLPYHSFSSYLKAQG